MDISRYIHYKNIIIYNDFCKNDKKCIFFKEWSYYDNNNTQARCKSCAKVGESYDVNIYPIDCKYLKDIEKVEEECNKHIMWAKLLD